MIEESITARFEDVCELPLEGSVLIEASAGTGKTHTIADLFVRLLVEGRFTIDQILVITFTELATAELKGRLRASISAQLAICHPGSEAAYRLRQAYYGFDEASIHTIHSWCQRCLGEFALETNSPPISVIIEDESSYLSRAVQQHWEQLAAEASPFGFAMMRELKFWPEDLMKWVAIHLDRYYAAVDVPATPDVRTCESVALAGQHALAEVWALEGERVRAFLLEGDALKRNSYTSGRVEATLALIETVVEQPERLQPVKIDDLRRGSSSMIKAGLKKGASSPGFRTFEVLEALGTARQALVEAYCDHLAIARRDLLVDVARTSAELKRADGVLAFRDLIELLHRELRTPHGQRLARRIAGRFPCALVDEFQDTDTRQLEILTSLHGAGQSTLYLVGDPKQSIYGFRGADVFAYLQASSFARHQYELGRNWRSTPGLVRVLNRLFAAHERVFGLAGIVAHPVEPARSDEDVIGKAQSDPAFVIHLVGPGDDAKAMTKREAETLTAQQCAETVSNALARGYSGGDVAVLVRRNNHVPSIRDALRDRGIDCVVRGRDDVRDTREADDIVNLLLAVSAPRNRRFMMNALSTNLLGFDAHALEELIGEAGERATGQWVERLLGWLQLWEQHGVLSLMRTVLNEDGRAARIVRHVGGERRLTNYGHLAELLAHEEQSHRLGPQELIRWLSQRASARQDEFARESSEPQRLERDSDLVRIMTVHAAKGLQFPVVVCPYLWDGDVAEAKGRDIAYHDPLRGHTWVLDLQGANDRARQCAQREARAESMRLTYVALTRAQAECHITWGNLKGAASSPLARLFYAQYLDLKGSALERGSQDDTSTEPNDGDWDSPTSAMISDGLDHLVARCDSMVAVQVFEPAPVVSSPARSAASAQTHSAGHLAARRFERQLPSGRRTVSFTSLAHRTHATDHDYDTEIRGSARPISAARPGGSSEVGDLERSPFTFPAGARAGICLHAILEWTAGSVPERERLLRYVDQQLDSFGFDRAWSPIAAQMIEHTLTTPLTRDRTLSIAGCAREQRLSELEFQFPVHSLDLAALLRSLVDGGHMSREILPDAAVAERQVAGYMRGYIDLVFGEGNRYYVVDYKSNWLGNDRAHYAPDALEAVMQRELYPLQWAIYACALERFLRLRIPDYTYDANFGGVYYLFLRAMHPRAGAESGVHFTRPSATTMRAIEAALVGN